MTINGKTVYDALVVDHNVLELDYDSNTRIISLIIINVWSLTRRKYDICNIDLLRSISSDVRIAVRYYLQKLIYRLNKDCIQLDYPKKNIAWIEENVLDIITEINIRRLARRC